MGSATVTGVTHTRPNTLENAYVSHSVRSDVVTTAPASRTSHHRADIQGLRAIAVGAVIAAHAGVGAVAGGFVGVDLFFVLSGFLITELLIRERERTGRISLPGFWARRVRRLLPASTLVLVVTAIASALFLPVVQRASVVTDIIWSTAFSANWRFAQQQTDYFAQDRAISPVQHYWSLGVEEQFYLVWPLLVVACAVAAHVLARRNTHAFRWIIGSTAAVITVVSCAYSIQLTGTNQPYAYFGTPARAWQLGIGAVLAAAVPLIMRLGRKTCTALAVVGLVGFAGSVLLLTEDGTGPAYPGAVALVPTLASAALIAAGTPSAGTIVGSVLAWRPLQWLGDASYSLYLWHFPILIIGMSQFEPAGWLVRTGLVAATVVIAGLSTRYVEAPIRTLPRLARRPALSLGMGVLLAGLSVSVAVASPKLPSDSATSVLNAQGQRVDLTTPLTDPLAGFDRGPDAPKCSLSFPQVVPDACDFGDVTSSRRLVLLGDSHAGNIFYGLRPAAEAAGWRLTWWTKNACPIADSTVYDETRRTKFTGCDEFRRKIIARTIAAKPDLVVLSGAYIPNKRAYDRETGKRLDRDQSYEEFVRGWRSTITQFTDRGIRVAVIKDWPRAPDNPVDCLAKTHDARECTFQRQPKPDPESVALRGIQGVKLVDVDDEFCPEKTCYPVVRNLLVYRDPSHLTRAYVEQLTPLLRKELLD